MRWNSWLAATAALFLLCLPSAPSRGGIEPSSASDPAGRFDPTELLAAQTRLGEQLVAKLAEEKGSGPNVVVSPASLAAVMAMLDLGANPEMRSAIYGVLGFEAKAPDKSTEALEALRVSVASLLKRGAGEGPLTLANAIIFDPTSKPHQLAVLGLKGAGAEVSIEELAKPETIERINRWISDQTKGLIPSILDKPLPQGGLVALNALYFKDRWQVPFDARSTHPAPFHTVDGRKIDLPMMNRSGGKLRIRQDDAFVAVELPYAAGAYSLVLVTTKDAPAPLTKLATNAAWLTGAGFTEQEADLSLPRFSLSASAELLNALDALGLSPARKSPDALNAFSPVAQTISRVVQKVELRVNEEGTEAAAVTAVTTVRSARIPPRPHVSFDKPFLFALRDAGTGFVLVSGYVGEPQPGPATE